MVELGVRKLGDKITFHALQERCGLYVKAAERLHVIAEAAHAFIRIHAPSRQDEVEELCLGRAHGHLLLSLVRR
jgi:hypothetical protein